MSRFWSHSRFRYISSAPVFFHRCCFRLIPVGDVEIHQSFSLSLPDTIDFSFAGFLARSSPHLYCSNEHHRQTPLIASPPVRYAASSPFLPVYRSWVYRLQPLTVFFSRSKNYRPYKFSRAFASQVRLACDRRLPTSKTPIPMKLNKNRSWTND